MVYILLILITIGVLLSSPEGKMLLGSIYNLITWIVGWGLFLLTIALLAGILSTPNIPEFVYGKIGTFVFIPFYSYIIYRLYLGYKAGRQSKSTFVTWSIVLGILILGCFSIFWQ